MKIMINYEGTEILVEEEIKRCLDELKREEESRKRKNRRNEILWDAILIEGMEVLELLNMSSIEDEVIEDIYLQGLYSLLIGLEDFDKKLIKDRFVNELKYKELSAKYNMPISSIQYKLERILKYIDYELNKI